MFNSKQLLRSLNLFVQDFLHNISFFFTFVTIIMIAIKWLNGISADMFEYTLVLHIVIKKYTNNL